MKLSTLTTRELFFEKIVKTIEGQKEGEGFTKQELAEYFGFTSLATIEKWCRQYPTLKKYCVYVPYNDGKNRTAVFVNLKYKKYLLDNRSQTKATEVY